MHIRHLITKTCPSFFRYCMRRKSYRGFDLANIVRFHLIARKGKIAA